MHSKVYPIRSPWISVTVVANDMSTSGDGESGVSVPSNNCVARMCIVRLMTPVAPARGVSRRV